VKESIDLRDLIGKYLNWVNDNQKTCRTEIHVTNQFLEFSGNKRINKISIWEVEQYKSQRRKDGLKPSTINRELTVLRSMFNRAVEWGEINQSPLKGVKKSLPFRPEDYDRKAEYIPSEVFADIVEKANESLRDLL
jgi:site-specific recombinase XerC